MAGGIVTVGRKQYASGLYWENSPSGRVSQAAKEAAKQPGSQADYYVIRLGNKTGRVPQFGLAPHAEGFRAGLPSLAGCLANQQPGSWIGAFRLREGTALVIVRDDLVVPDGDVFFLDETEARDRLYQEMAIGGFQRIYAPEPWGIPGGDTMPLTLLLNERTDVRLRPVALSSQTKAGIAIGVGILFLLLGIGWYVQEQKMKEEQVRLENLAALERLRLEAMRRAPVQQAPNYPPPERYWEKRPRPLEIIAACQESLKKVNVGVAGWSISGMRCNEGALTITWNRTGGFSNPPPNSSVSETGNAASTTIALTGLAPRGEEQLWDTDVITRRYLNQNWTGSMSRAPDDPPPPPPPDYRGTWDPPPAPWVKRSFTVTVPVLPWTLPEFFSELPGVIVTSLMVNGSGATRNETWTLEGVIYENRR